MINEQYVTTTHILAKAGCCCIAAHEIPCSEGVSKVEFWGVPERGLIITQRWPNGGCAVYADWPVGSTYEDLEAFLRVPREAYDRLLTSKEVAS